MANARGERPAVRRQSMVFVEIPPSPLHTARKAANHPHMSSTSTGCKENALSRLQSSKMISSTASTIANSHKRKLDAEGDQLSTKKPRQAPTRPVDDLEDSSDEHPNGFVYCHQCNMKRDVSGESHLRSPSWLLTKSISFCSMHSTRPERSSMQSQVLRILPQETVRSYLGGHPSQHHSCAAHPFCPRSRGRLFLRVCVHYSFTDSRADIFGFSCPLCDGICNCIDCRHARGFQSTGYARLSNCDYLHK